MQLELAHARNPNCPHVEFIDDDDLHCNNHGMAPKGYVPLGEDSEDHELQFASVNGPYLETVKARHQPLPTMPSYIPVVPHGSGKLCVQYEPEWVGVQLAEVVSGTKLNTAKNIRARLGVPTTTKIVLLSYGLDGLIENLWPHRRRVLKELADADIEVVTAVNYSIWDMHPHPEKVFNVKRSLITFEELQEFGQLTIPHVYWYGQKSMSLWAAWLNVNDCVKTIAIDAQTLVAADWSKFIVELKQFIRLVGRQLHFLITGPYSPHRVKELKSIVKSMTITNTYAAMAAWSSRKLIYRNGVIERLYSDDDKSMIFKHNTELYSRLTA
ncbi:MAG TPA: DUF4417 domain-containing protein [Candidatus Saccharimonadales bacterium]|nr:DUF4417 domain-containing protein [Candidatus Saccharimonadales bacterium]